MIGKTMYVTKHIDWLSCTISQAHDFHSVFPLLEWSLFARGMHGYKARYINTQTLTTVDTGSDNPEMGHHFTFSGDALAIFRGDEGASDSSVIGRLLRYHATASRIDLTINIHDGLLTPRAVYDALAKGKLHAKADVSRFIEGKRGDVQGDTLYIGAPKSDSQFRCYNKAAEASIVDRGAWVRLELELRRIRANGAFQSCGINGVSQTISGHMEDFIDWEQHEYRRAIGADGVEPVDIPRKKTNRQRWLLGQVAGALAKEMRLDDEFANKFWREVLEVYKALGKD